jgi:hypothetical protein
MEEAMDQMAAELAAEDNAEGPKPAASKFDDKPLAASQVAIDLPMRMAVNGTCDVLITRLSPGKTFDFVTFLIVGATHRVKSENVKLANFHGCQPGPARDLQALIFQLDDGQFAFAIPRSLEEVFLGSRTTRWFENYSLEEPKWITALLPDALKPYVELKEDFVFVHGRAIDYLMLSFANSQLGKRFAPDRLDIAIQQLYEQKEKDASYFGINASGTQLIRGGPLIYFFLSFELWRRVRRLPKGKLQSGKYWFAFETSDFIGSAYAYTYALLPFILGALVYCIFVVSQGLGLVVLGRWITLSGLVTLSFPSALEMGWYSLDVMALCLLFFVPLQFFILFLISRKLAAVVANNLRA